jgi:hypothetical protein
MQWRKCLDLSKKNRLNFQHIFVWENMLKYSDIKPMNFSISVTLTTEVHNLSTLQWLCRPGSAQKPRLRLGLRGLRLSNNLGRAKAPRDGWPRLGSAKAAAFDLKQKKKKKIRF